MDVPRYLARIGFTGPVRPDLDTLRALMRAHQFTVPFENLDIHLGVPIVLDYDEIYAKIVHRHRGGFCYELNGLFAKLLTEIGFRVDYLSARVTRGSGWDAEFGHIALQVFVADVAYLVDVGYGDSIRAPLEMRPGAVQHTVGREFRLARYGSGLVLEIHSLRGSRGGYWFEIAPRPLADFAAMCRYHQTSPRSWFTRKRMCTLPTDTGRLTLAEMTFIRTDGEARRETVITSAERYLDVLSEHFGVALSAAPPNMAQRPGQRLHDEAWVWRHRARKLRRLARHHLRTAARTLLGARQSSS